MRAINVTLYRLAKALKVVKALQQMYDEMKPYTVKELMSKYGLKADRADVILPTA